MLDSIKAGWNPTNCCWKIFRRSVIQSIVSRASPTAVAVNLPRNRTQISWTANEVVLPTIEGSPAFSAVIRVAGITGRIRGMKFKRSDGQTVRPSLVILDDRRPMNRPGRLASAPTVNASLRARCWSGGAGAEKSAVSCLYRDPSRRYGRPDSRYGKTSRMDGERTKMVYAFPTMKSSGIVTPKSVRILCVPMAICGRPPRFTEPISKRWTPERKWLGCRDSIMMRRPRSSTR